MCITWYCNVLQDTISTHYRSYSFYNNLLNGYSLSLLTSKLLVYGYFVVNIPFRLFMLGCCCGCVGDFLIVIFGCVCIWSFLFVFLKIDVLILSLVGNKITMVAG